MIGLTPSLPDDRPLRFLFLGAHSDDIEIGCGATALQLVRRYKDAHFAWAVFSGAGPRTEEARSSASDFLEGAAHTRINIHDFRDGYFPAEQAAIKDEFEKLKDFQPDVIFTHYRADLHQDHRVISELARNTWRSHVVLEYEIPKYDGDLDRPNFYVPAEEWAVAKKVRLLLQHFPTQASKHWFDEATFRAILRIRGLECHSPTGLAEAYHGFKATLAF